MKMAKSLAAMLLTLALMLSAGLTSVFAQDEYTMLNGDNTKIKIPYQKTLNIHGAEVYPAHTVTLTVGTGTAINRSGSVTAEGSVPPETLTFSGAKTDTNKEGTFDFSSVKFPKPGLYKFPVTETISNDKITTVPTTEEKYYVYVQVDNVNKQPGYSNLEYAATAYKIVKGSSTDPDKESSPDGKSDKTLFENEYLNNSFKVKKEVTGNQGDKTKEFTIKVNLSNGTDGEKYAVKWAAGTHSATPKVNGTQVTDGGNPVIINANSEVTLTLKDGDEVEFFGIPAGVKYTATEPEPGDYTVSGEVTEPKEVVKEDTDNATIVNKKEGTIPTGIFINNWPYITMVLVVIAAAVIFVSRRNRRLEDEDL